GAADAGDAGRSSPRRPRAQSRYGGLIAYGGSFGTGLLARSPLADVDFLVYEATVNARGAIYARVPLGELGPVHVFATHFSPGGAEQVPQVDELVAWVAHKAPRGEPAILLGDLNTAPGSSLFRTILGAGFREPDPLDRRGTFGGGLGTGEISESGGRIDHILVRDLDAPVASRRILDAPITIATTAATATGTATVAVKTTLSDHFGVLATIEPRHP
nr:endonuclease/exonuclease/phosphatase family protein [Myxococcota bacterium]